MRNSIVMMVLLGFLLLTLLAPFSALAGLMIILLTSVMLSVFWNLLRTAITGKTDGG